MSFNSCKIWGYYQHLTLIIAQFLRHGHLCQLGLHILPLNHSRRWSTKLPSTLPWWWRSQSRSRLHPNIHQCLDTWPPHTPEIYREIVTRVRWVAGGAARQTGLYFWLVSVKITTDRPFCLSEPTFKNSWISPCSLLYIWICTYSSPCMI